MVSLTSNSSSATFSHPQNRVFAPQKIPTNRDLWANKFGVTLQLYNSHIIELNKPVRNVVIPRD